MLDEVLGTGYIAALLVGGVINAGVAWRIVDYQAVPGSRLFSGYYLVSAIYQWTFVAMVVAPAAVTRQVLAVVVPALSWAIGPLFLAAVRRYTGRWESIASAVTGALVAFYVVVAGLAVSDVFGVHGLMHASITVSPAGYVVFEPTRLFLFVFLVHGAMFAVGLVLVGELFLRSRRISRRQAGAQALASVVAVLVTVLFLTGRATASDIGVCMGVFAVATAWALFGHGGSVVRPVRRDVVLDDIEEGVVVLGTDDRVVDFNRVAGEVFPELAEGVGRPAEAVLPAEVVDGSAESVRRGQGSRRRVYDVSVTELTDDGETHGRLVTLRDVTDLTEYADELERQTDRLEQFTGTVSHDLRNPLTVAKAQVEAVRADREDDRLAEASEVLDEMDRLIDEALTLAREGRTIDERERVTLRSVVDDAWRTSDTAGATLANGVSPTVRVSADRARLSRAFENLFRNAADHGPDDVTVRVDTTEDGFLVEDDGPGIPPEQRGRVFKQGFTTAEDGTGFGLAIVASIVEAHGWDVRAGEGDDGGARFVVTGVASLARATEDEYDRASGIDADPVVSVTGED